MTIVHVSQSQDGADERDAMSRFEADEHQRRHDFYQIGGETAEATVDER